MKHPPWARYRVARSCPASGQDGRLFAFG